MQQNNSSSSASTMNIRPFRYTLLLKGILAGIAAGLTAVCFRLILGQAERLRQTIGTYIAAHPQAVLFWVLALLILAAAVTFLLRAEPYISGSGIPQVAGEMQGKLSQSWLKVLTAKFLGGILTVGAGLSLGREGPSIQMLSLIHI